MKIKSAKSFRLWYKTTVKQINEVDNTYNENFVGTYHELENGKKVKGFFEMYHGDKPDIAGYLPSILKIAEDGQTIYEFLQNAVDCNSTHFYIFYNEKYFLAINNGAPFDIEGLQSILNIAQTTKKDADKIGRFGIGFKLAHRLVGKNDGTDELCRQYKGPILFSWSRLQDLDSLLQGEIINPIQEDDPEFNSAPYLLKLILTNFPSDSNETIKDIDYQDRILFPREELNELVSFLNENFRQHSATLTKDVLKQGSLFFIKLGEGKKNILDKDYSELKNGIEYSMNTLKRLDKVYFNSDVITKIPLQLEEGKIAKDTDIFKRIDPEYKDFDIKFSVGFNQLTFGNENTYSQIKALKEKPNFYKYFPMGDEINGFGFMVHCDSFSNEANRRKLHEDEINKNLFPEIAKHIISRLDDYKAHDKNKFLNLYAALLLSNIPDRQNNKWLRSVFYDSLLFYLKTTVPTQRSFADDSKNVKINRLKLNLNLADFGLGHIQWFYWKEKTDQILLNEAKEKLDIKEWDIRDIVENANLDSINNWIENCDNETYLSFLKELEESDLRQKTKEKICNIKLFQFSNGTWYSSNEIVSNEKNYRDQITSTYKFSIVIICNYKTEPIKDILQKLGFVTSNLKIPEYKNIYASIQMPVEKSLYDYIAEKCKTNTLTPAEKKKLFLNFTNEHTKFTDVGDATLKELCLFADKNRQIKPLKEFVNSRLNIPEWLQSYELKADEYFTELNPYLISEAKIYSDVILPNWDNIIENITNIQEFYQSVKYYYDLNEDNKPLKNQNFIFISKEEGFVNRDSDVFHNSKMFELQTKYINFQSAISSLLGAQSPNKLIAGYFLEEPFKLDNSDLFDWGINDSVLTVDEVKALLKFCELNNEHFFEHCIIEQDGNSFSVYEKSDDKFQIVPPDRPAKKFIEENCSDSLIVLPFEFSDYNNESGIIKRQDLHCKIIECVDVDDFKEELVDIVAYDTKLQFIEKLSEIRFDVEADYSKDDYEYKLLSLACDVVKTNDKDWFRDKIVIQFADKIVKISNIQSFSDKLIYQDKELSLSQILPESYKDSKTISALIDIFIKLGLPQEKLYDLMGVNKSPEVQQIFTQLSKQIQLHNWQQLYFVLTYASNTYNTDISNFQVTDQDNAWRKLDNHFYLNKYSFIQDSHILSSGYAEIADSIDQSNSYLLHEPQVSKNEFRCPFIRQSLSSGQQTDLIDFIFKQWGKDDKKHLIRSFDWSKINKTETKTILGFNPKNAVFPSKYAYDSEEQLPDYLISWIGADENKKSFLSDLGVWTENSVIVNLRKFFSGENDTFEIRNLQQEQRFNSDTQALKQTLLWVVAQQKELSKEKHFDTLEKVVELISNISLNIEYDYTLLNSNSLEWSDSAYLSWKNSIRNVKQILLYDGEMPRIVKISNNNFVFIRFNEGNLTFRQNIIYINKNDNIKKELETLADQANSPFSIKDLYQIFGKASQIDNQNKVEVPTGMDRAKAADILELTKEYTPEQIKEALAKLKQHSLATSEIQKVGTAILQAGGGNGLSKERQIAENYEAKQVVQQHLESLGFAFPDGIDGYSTAYVEKNGIKYPIVIKSYKKQDEDFHIGVNEWIHLMKPNAMLWANFGGGKVGYINIFDLFRNQSQLSVAFITENLDVEDRLKKFADLLHYFKDIHFDFDFDNFSVPYRSRASSMKDYRFDTRQTEEDINDNDSDSML